MYCTVVGLIWAFMTADDAPKYPERNTRFESLAGASSAFLAPELFRQFAKPHGFSPSYHQSLTTAFERLISSASCDAYISHCTPHSSPQSGCCALDGPS